MADGAGYGAGFALIVVLFILLIIVGASYVGGGFGGYGGFGGFGGWY
ncbi:YjcZ family sporulation protein [Bacillus sp. EB600]|nr:YjcZ family sporulation protein [Bacillus sp. EB600]MCQ6282139.1 YjcZ family sporulation protein [Bacillus sp. EB600]